jgi:hypothetical protein
MAVHPPMELLIPVLVFVLLDLAALRWGYDSRDAFRHIR